MDAAPDGGDEACAADDLDAQSRSVRCIRQPLHSPARPTDTAVQSRCGDAQVLRKRRGVRHGNDDVLTVPADLYRLSIDLENEARTDVQLTRRRLGHARVAPSLVVMRRLPLSFHVARGACEPVSRGTSTVMSTNS